MIRCQQPNAHPDRCSCSPAGTEQVSSAWLAQLREEYRQYAEECERLRGELQHRDKLLAEMQAAWDTALEAGKLMNAQLTAIREQEPVAWQSRFTDEEWAKCSRGHFDWVKREPEAFPGGYEARELYALPPQQLGAIGTHWPPFAKKVLAKMRRFYSCAEDPGSGGVDIGRHWLDLLTQLELLNRVQRSPALWEISQQGEDLLHAEVNE
ncbi:hypothetical protein [Pseudomonas sp. USHLN015]|uniref:hypothetical protein n=1 Tax=Pseudomonas sp. USHLN015 TaxID=3081296 RepID=UPI00301C3E0B